MQRHKRPTRYTATLKEIFSIMFRHSKGIRILFPIELFFLILDGLAASQVPALLKFVIDGLESGYETFLQERLWQAVMYALIISCGWLISAIIQHYLKEKNSTTIMINIQLSLFEHIQNLSIDFYQNTYIGEITNRLTNDIYQSVGEIYYAFTHFIWLLGLLIPSLITMAGYDLRFFAVFITIMVSFGIVIKFLLPVIRRKHRVARDQMGHINARITESIYSIMLVKSFAREKDMAQSVHRESRSYLAQFLAAVRIRVASYNILGMLINFLGPTLIICIGALMRMAVGMIVAFYSYWYAVGSRIQNILNLFNRVFTALASFDRINEFFQKTPLVQDDNQAGPLFITSGAIELENVTFHYPTGSSSGSSSPAAEENITQPVSPEKQQILSGVSLSIPAKAATAIVGRSGSGKTTLFNLLLRFFDPATGTIRIGGQDIRMVEQKSLRSQIGLVMQDTCLLNGTVRDNLLFVKPDATAEEMITALQHAKIWEYFSLSANGLETVIGERGVKLSGGQRQRISIARVFLKNPPILLFDEATSALDSETEQSIFQTLETLLIDRTSIIITHRLSTIRKCRLIVVLDSGQAVATGTHEELLDSCPLYRELCHLQDVMRN